MPVPGSGSGALSLIYEGGGEAEMLAENIQQALVDAGFADLGIQERPGLAVLNRTRMPAVLVEAGFIDNPRTTGFSTRISRLLRAMWQMGLWPLSGSLQRGFRNIIRFR